MDPLLEHRQGRRLSRRDTLGLGAALLCGVLILVAAIASQQGPSVSQELWGAGWQHSRWDMGGCAQGFVVTFRHAMLLYLLAIHLLTFLAVRKARFISFVVQFFRA